MSKVINMRALDRTAALVVTVCRRGMRPHARQVLEYHADVRESWGNPLRIASHPWSRRHGATEASRARVGFSTAFLIS